MFVCNLQSLAVVILTTVAQLVSAYTVALSVMGRMIARIILMKDFVSNNVFVFWYTKLTYTILAVIIITFLKLYYHNYIFKALLS